MMELQVWVDGIPRVISGASDATTCEEVVRALAQATGRTGRFTLVEQWRGNERMLTPQDRPLHLLQQWGEYASDVNLILRHSKLTAASDGFSSNMAPPGPPFMTRSASLKKSLTFSGPHQNHVLTPSKQLAFVQDLSNPTTSSLDRNTRHKPATPADHKTPLQGPTENRSRPTAMATAIRSGNQSLERQRGEADGEKQRAEKEELINLVNQQLDRLQQQEQRMIELQVDIVDVESRQPDVTKETSDTQTSSIDDDKLSQLAAEIQQLEQLDKQLDAELGELELVSWEDKLVREQQLQTLLSKQAAQTKLKVNDCQMDVSNTQQLMKQLSQQIEDTRSAVEIQGQIKKLQEELEKTTGMGRETSTSLTSLEMEIKDMEINIAMKKQEIEELEKELADTNLLDFPDLSRSLPIRRSAQDLPVFSHKSLTTRALATPPRSVIFNAKTLKEAVTGESTENLFV